MDLSIKEEFAGYSEDLEFLNEGSDLTDDLYTVEDETPPEVTHDHNYISSYQNFLSSLPTISEVELPKEQPLPILVRQKPLYHCPSCCYKTKHQNEYIQHRNQHSYRYKCNVCRFASIHRFVIINHYQMNHLTESQECVYFNHEIPGDFKYSEEQEREVKQEHIETEEPVYPEEKESAETQECCKQEEDYHKNSFIHHDFPPLSICHVCKYATPISRNLDIHMKMHSENQPYKCNLCSFTSYNSFIVLNHYQLNHTDELKSEDPLVFKCHVCGLLMTDGEVYKEHSLDCYIHKYCFLINYLTSSNSYLCNMCNFKAPYSFILTNHVRMAHEYSDSQNHSITCMSAITN